MLRKGFYTRTVRRSAASIILSICASMPSLASTIPPIHAAPSMAACTAQNPRTDPVHNPHNKLVAYFPQTGHTVSGAFLSFYKSLNNHGSGVKILGYPLSEAFCEVDPFSPPGGPAVVDKAQYFERGRLYLSLGQVQISNLGDLHSAFDPNGGTPADFILPGSPSGTFPINPYFSKFYNSHDGPDLFGATVSDGFIEENNDGSHNTYYVQYFQKARLEYHLNNADPYKVEIGQIGRQWLQIVVGVI
jgi:hypothetical protein